MVRRIVTFALAPVALLALAAGPAAAHEAQHVISARKLVLKVSGKKRKLLFKATGEGTIAPTHDPAETETSLMVVATAGNGRTALIELDPTRWKGKGGRRGYRYKDRKGSRGGVRSIVFRPGKIVVKAGGPNLPWSGDPAIEAAWVLFRVEEETYCALLPGKMKGRATFRAARASAPAACPATMCGNGEREEGEECDDGNLVDTDGCTTACTRGTCQGDQFPSTFAAIQATVFDNPTFGCTAAQCHGGAFPQAGLDLTAGHAYASLVDAESTGSANGMKRVLPGEPEQSFLYRKLAWKTLGRPADGGSPMPTGTPAELTADQLDAIARWIRGGAPADRVVEGTADKLGTCLPEADPLTIPPPPPPGAGVGVQLRQTPWDLPAGSEDEICMATYYDFTQTDLVPDSARVACPPALQGPTNPSGECFRYHAQQLFQDPQSHHSIIRTYLGDFDVTHPAWGPWTYKFQDHANPLHGTPCDPRAIDPATGTNPGCSGAVHSAVACLGYGPPDFSRGIRDGGATADKSPSFSGSQEPYFEQEFADGVYAVLPMQGIVAWNSHAFNLTHTDTTMSQYLNLEVARPEDQRFQAQAIFDAGSIFVQNVPPFATREYCRTYTLPQHARLFELGSHTHRHGVRFRIWAPPNAPCIPGQPACVPPDDPSRLVYVSTEYTDPLQLRLDPPWPYDGVDGASRTFLYCSLYDNGATPESPPVKRRSTSPVPPLVFNAAVGPGGPCGDATVACLGGPSQGMLCRGDDAACGPGGVCDACPLRGGVTTEDEMFILLGTYYVDGS
jgi:cysteine-rich repeat protein